MTALTRREFFRISAAVGGGLVVAFVAPGCVPSSRPGASHSLGLFVTVGTDGTVSIFVPVPEIGQGVRTSLSMLVAEELDVPWSQIRIFQLDAADEMGPHPRAAGSGSVRAHWLPLREAGALARAALVSAAAARWSVTPESCATDSGHVVHAPSRRRIAYRDLAEDAAALPVPSNVPLKDPASFRIIGTDVTSPDLPAILTGSVTFGPDVRVPGMVFATVLRPPTLGGRLRALDDSAARAVSGVQHIVQVEPVGPPERPSVRGGVAVIASNTWAAIKGRAALVAEWDAGPNANESTARLHAESLRALDGPAREYRRGGNLRRAVAASARRISATYHVPLLAHVPMEPPCCVVHVTPEGCELWAPTQVPQIARAGVARQLGIPPAAVALHVPRVGGGFGRRLGIDFILEAVEVARQLSTPVMVMWTREDDLQFGFYRPFHYHRFEAGLDATGRPVAWHHRQAGTSRYAFRPAEHPAASEFRAGTWPASFIADHLLDYVLVRSNIPTGAIRAPGDNGFIFPIECFVDELARTSGIDPLQYRLDLLGEARLVPHERDGDYDTARMRRVLETAAEGAGWTNSRTPGRGMGIASGLIFGTYAATVIEVELDPAAGRFYVRRVVTAIDCGTVVHPSGVRAQVEGGVIDGLSAALYGEITMEEGRVVQTNFDSYRLLRYAESPRIDVHMVPSTEPPTGAGEPPYPIVAPALANAIHDAGGARVRDLPIRADRVFPNLRAG